MALEVEVPSERQCVVRSIRRSSGYCQGITPALPVVAGGAVCASQSHPIPKRGHMNKGFERSLGRGYRR